MENTNWYRRFKLIFFGIFFTFFLITYIYFEISGEMFGAARLIFACMIAISLYGIVKYGRCREKISAISLRERWGVGANSGVLRL